MRKKQKSVMMAAALSIVLMAGCGTGNEGNANNPSSPAANGGSGTATDKPAAPFKLSLMLNLHEPEVPSDKIEKLIEQKTNTELSIQWVPDGSYDDKINASFATGSLPQAVQLKNAASLTMFRDAIKDGQFWEVGHLIDQYPNLAKLNKDVLNNTSVGGKIYSLYREVALSRQGIIFRKDWADNLGLSAPKNIDELYAMLKAFKENDPDKNGKNDTIGLTDRSDLIFGAFKTVSSYFGTPNNWGEKDGKLLPEFMFQEYIDTMNFFKKLHEEGLINQDFPVTSKTDQQNLFASGKAGMYIGALGDVQSLSDKVKDVNPAGELDLQNRIEGPKGTGIWSTAGYGTVYLFPKSAVKSEEELKQILAFFDKLMTPELANLIYWGIEGEHHTINNGKVVPNEDTKLTNREVKPYQSLQVGGQSTIPELLDPEFQLPVKAKSEEMILDNESILINDPTTSLESVTFIEQGVRLQEQIKNATYQYMMGDIDEAGFQKAVDKWLKDGGQKIIDEFNAAG
ncbi:extracellular solute-binding protein [Paenibacillus sp. N4]|uniref:extracellular solute-binding protein n=1 Tax=Paenibacillus vietnamensis TaxID=2590547 RepID=UPI001CD136DF|nr:extracellular solute-binding protein [Paenibacillus vietnamensis]MCA0757108.1 extracellular solute-binding protein [Paenibacillus vietnamensis]